MRWLAVREQSGAPRMGVSTCHRRVWRRPSRANESNRSHSRFTRARPAIRFKLPYCADRGRHCLSDVRITRFDILSATERSGCGDI